MMKISDVKKQYGTKEQIIPVLKGVSFEIEDGDFVVILGPSGSGKSTLLNVISGLERADGGQVIYQGNDISTMQDAKLTQFRKENIGFIFQQYFLLPHLNVDKNVRMGADLAKNKDYKKILKEVGLADKLTKYPSELSGGEQQRVAIARALAKRPNTLFLDEPTGALDEETGRSVLDYLVKLQKELKFTMIMVTHNQNIAEMAHMVIHMNSGLIKQIEHHTVQKNAYEISW